MEILLKVDALTKSFGFGAERREVLKGFSCDIPKGVVWFVTGPNGIGKTVFARCLAGLLKFDGGQIEVEGRRFTKLDCVESRLLGVTYLPQDLPRARVRVAEFLSSGDIAASRWYRPQTLRDHVNRISKEYGLEVHAQFNQFLSDLSMGELQRVFLAGALLTSSRLLILDEPTAYLSKEESNALSAVLGTVTSREKTVIIIAHPEQYALPGAETWTFTASGLKRCDYQPLNLAPAPSLSEKCGWDLMLRISNKLLPVPPGSIVSIRGAATKEFGRFTESLALFPNQFLTASPTETQVKFVYFPSDATHRCLAQRLDLFRNTLIQRWRDKRWSLGRTFLHRRKGVEFLTNPIMRDLFIGNLPESFVASQLSGGNLQKFALSQACFGRIDLLVASNVFRSLDNVGVRQAVDFLHRKADAGMTTVLLSTGPGTEEKIAHYLCRFSSGRLEQLT